jgi:hypothetical protein
LVGEVKPKLKLEDISQKVADIWNGPHVPMVAPEGKMVHEAGARKFVPTGSKVVLTHPFGHIVTFDLTRSDLMLPIDQFSTKSLEPALAEIRKALAK